MASKPTEPLLHTLLISSNTSYSQTILTSRRVECLNRLLKSSSDAHMALAKTFSPSLRLVFVAWITGNAIEAKLPSSAFSKQAVNIDLISCNSNRTLEMSTVLMMFML